MFVYMFLPLFSEFATGFVVGTSLKRETPSSVPVQFNQTDVLPREDKPARRYWISTQYKKYLPAAEEETYKFLENNEVEFERRPNAYPGLEISKSIELAFDPKMQTFVPVTEIPKREDNSLLLFSMRTYKHLKKIFYKLENENKKPSGLRSVKNFQTGRFKLGHYKS